METEYLADEREFSETTLANGLRCVFVRDPRMHNVAVQLDIGGGHESDPAGLSGLATICFSLVLRGSSRFPGVGCLLEFTDDNDIHLVCPALFSKSTIAAESPLGAFDEYLDRLSDTVGNPNLSQEGLEYAELRYGGRFHPQMLNVDSKVEQVINYMECRYFSQSASLFRNKDLLSRLRQHFDRYFRPSNMVIYTMADLPIETMKERVQDYFNDLSNQDATDTSSPSLPSIDPSFHKTLRVDGHALLAKTYIKSDEKHMSLFFLLPPKMPMSSPLYVSHFFSTSQRGSVQHKLKSEGLIDYIIAEHKTTSGDIQHLEMRLSLTKKGSDSIQVILSYIFGYLEILKQMQPSWEHFQQAKSYFQCLRRLDSSLMVLDRYSCELLIGSDTSDLRDAEVPRVFNPGDIQKALKCLTLQNCFIAVVSDQYVDAPLIEGSEYFLQLSIENIRASPRFDGLAEPQLDPLIGSSRLPLVVNSDMHLICERPVIYQKSTADEIYSMLNIGLQSSGFAELPVTVQRLYAAMLNYKLWLETTKDICEVNVSIADNGLSIDVKSVPGSLLPLIRLLMEYLTSPLGSEYNNYFMTRKFEEEQALHSRLFNRENALKSPDIFSDGIELKTQLQQLRSVHAIDDLPGKVEGDLVLVFSGNATESSSLLVMSILSVLQTSEKSL